MESTFNDKIILRLAEEEKANIFATDVAVSALMTSLQANYPWDVIIKKFEGLLFIDKRDEENMLDWQTVSETSELAYQPLDEDGVNGVRQLMKEAAKISSNFQANMQGKAFKKLEEEDPFKEDDDQVICSQGYYYNMFKLDSKKTICIRSAVHSYFESTDELMNCYVLPEWSVKRQNWVKDLEVNATACLTKELTDNTTKFCRWTVMSLLAGVDKMRFSFVQRINNKADQHQVVGSFTTQTSKFADTLNINYEQCWAILKDILEVVSKREEEVCSFVYLKDLNQQPTYRLIKIVESGEDEQNADADQDSDEN